MEDDFFLLPPREMLAEEAAAAVTPRLLPSPTSRCEAILRSEEEVGPRPNAAAAVVSRVRSRSGDAMVAGEQMLLRWAR